MGFESMRAVRRSLGMLVLLPWLVSCGGSGFSDLDAFMAEKRARPRWRD
jgi:Tfp pilus assembly protein PilP